MTDSADDRHGPVRLPAPPPFCGIEGHVHTEAEWNREGSPPKDVWALRRAYRMAEVKWVGLGFDANGSPVEYDLTDAIRSLPCPSPSSPEPNSTP